MTASAFPATPDFDRRVAGRPLALLLDVDGTLSALAPRPEYAVVTPETRRVLSELANTPDVHVAIVTGRAADDARRLVCVDDAWIIGNHGIELARPGQPAEAQRGAEQYRESVAAAAHDARELGDRYEGVVVEDKRWTLSVHYRLAHPRVVPELTEGVEQIGARHGLRLTRGKEVLELRPPIGIDKGTAALEVAELLGALRPGASLLYAGDDQTDEDAFRALRRENPAAVTIRVGDVETVKTAAEFIVAHPEEMRALLTHILERRRSA